jgi:hypothetical protein
LFLMLQKENGAEDQAHNVPIFKDAEGFSKAE